MKTAFHPILLTAFLALCAHVSAAQGDRSAAQLSLDNAEKLEKIWWAAGNMQKIADEYTSAIAVWRELGDRRREAETMLRAARNLMVLEGGKSENGRLYSERAAEIFEALGDSENEAFSLEMVAWFESFYARDKSVSIFERALALARKARSLRAEAHILCRFALNLNQTDAERGIEMLDKALPIAESAKADRTIADIHFASGLLFWGVGDYDRSLEHYELAAKTYTSIGDHSWATSSVENAALVYNLLDEPDRVLSSYTKALPFRRDNGHTTAIADNLTSISAAMVKLGQPTEALNHLAESLKMYEQTANEYGIAWVFRVYGEAHLALGRHARAIDYFERSFALQTKLTEQNAAAKAVYLIAKAELSRGNLAAGLQQIERAVAMIEGQRARLESPDLRLAFFTARRDYYELYIEILYKLSLAKPNENYDLKALDASERSRARSLFEAIANRPDTEVLTAQQIQDSLDPDTALLEFSIGKRASFLFVITRDNVRIFELPPAAEIEPLVADLRRTLSGSGRRSYARFVIASRRLYEILLKNGEAEFKEKKNLLIAPDDSLNYLPFDVLLTSEPGRSGHADFETLPYALKSWTIRHTPSASVLSEIHKRKRSGEKKQPEFIAFGDPVYGQNGHAAPMRVQRVVNDAFDASVLPRLLDSGREIAGIKMNFGDSARVFVRDDASESNVKRLTDLRRARIVHFATHGIVNERQPQFSGLLLSRDNEDREDGLLQTSEIYSLDLDAEMVVLSACRTALGKNLQGEGVIGLTRAFLRAGSRSVAATLWQVEDSSTADLMIDFYRDLNANKSKTQSLRRAKLAMLKQPRFAHPHFWAPFVLIGSD